MDPQLEKSYSGQDGTPGFVYAWSGPKAGKGEQEIKRIVEGEKIESELRFIQPMPGKAMTEIKLRAVTANITTVSWHMKGRSNYPMNFMNLFIDGILGNDLQSSLYPEGSAGEYVTKH